ncbi:MAG: peptidase S1, partial [Acidimicrobiales bacterium]
QAQGHPADIGVVVLDTAVTGVTPASLPALGSLEGSLTQSSVFTAVGYGDFAGLPDPQTPPFPNDGYRRYAVSSFNSLGPAYLRLSQNASHGDGGTCNGDSGGPNFIGAGPTETNVIASITITGDTRCKSTNVGYRLDLPEAQSFLAPFLS